MPKLPDPENLKPTLNALVVDSASLNLGALLKVRSGVVEIPAANLESNELL